MFFHSRTDVAFQMSVAAVKPIFIVGPLPPPIHGASVITRAVATLLSSAGAEVVECNISPTAKARGWRWHMSRAGSYLKTLRSVLAGTIRSTVYISLSGGNGLFYDLLIVAAARLRAHRMVLHHHSYDYVDRRRRVLALILSFAPSDHIHLVLCNDMGRKIRSLYGAELRCVRISNRCFSPPQPRSPEPRSRLARIGYLSYVSRDKGVDRFFDIAARFQGDTEIAFDLAGPYASDAERQYVEQRLATVGNVTYHGPLYGAAKQAFYRDIDAFMLPSRYSNEAEPLVVYEAMSAGLPVVVTSRGCLCEMVDPDGAVILDRDGINIEPAVQRIKRWRDDPADYVQASTASFNLLVQFERERDATQAALLAAFDLALGIAAAPAQSPSPVR